MNTETAGRRRSSVGCAGEPSTSRRRVPPTEIDAICGAIVQAGEKTGLPTPTLRAVWQLVRAIQPEEK